MMQLNTSGAFRDAGSYFYRRLRCAFDSRSSSFFALFQDVAIFFSELFESVAHSILQA